MARSLQSQFFVSPLVETLPPEVACPISQNLKNCVITCLPGDIMKWKPPRFNPARAETLQLCEGDKPWNK
ncbi:MAG: hypothetical protein HXS51_01335 [Theionarchaea archaeon]|nr:hypothetical protein [Theionarchaea archaeon]